MSDVIVYRSHKTQQVFVRPKTEFLDRFVCLEEFKPKPVLQLDTGITSVEAKVNIEIKAEPELFEMPSINYPDW